MSAPYEDDAFEDEAPDPHSSGEGGTASAGGHEAQPVAAGDEDADQAAVKALRHTVEYSAAWDVEVWKVIQLRHFESEMRSLRSAAVKALQEELKQKEAHALSVVQRQEKDVALREKRLAEDERSLERRKQKLLEAERELMLLKKSMADQQLRRDEAHDAAIRRLKEESSHQAQLWQQKLQHADDVARRSDERWQQSQQEYTKLFEAFSHYKTTHVAGGSESASIVQLQLDRLKAEHAQEVAALQSRAESKHHEALASQAHRTQQLEDSLRRLTAAHASRKGKLQAVEQSLQDAQALVASLRDQLRIAQMEKETLRMKLSTTMSHGTPTIMGTSSGNGGIHAALVGAAAGAAAGSGPPPQQPPRNCGIHHSHSSEKTMSPNRNHNHQTEPPPREAASGGNVAARSFSVEQRAIVTEIRRLERVLQELIQESGGAYRADESTGIVREIRDKINRLKSECVLQL